MVDKKIKCEVTCVTTIIMDDFTEKYRVDMIFDKKPNLKLGDCEVIENCN